MNSDPRDPEPPTPFPLVDPYPSVNAVKARRSRKKLWIALAILLAVIAFGTGGLVAFMDNTGSTTSASPTTPSVTAPTTTAPATTAPATTTAPPSTPSPTTIPPTTVPAVPSFDQMSQFVRSLYGALPRDTDFGWSVFDANYSNQFSRASYEQFWSTIRSVTVLSVAPRDATSVTLRLRYVTQNGNTDTESRSMSVISKQGKLAVYDSRRLGPA